MNLMISLRLSEQIQVDALHRQDDQVEPAFLEHWYGDMFTLKNRKIFVFTEYRTRFSVFAYGRGITTAGVFEPFFHDAIRSAMLHTVPRLTLGAAENPPVAYYAARPSPTRTSQQSHMAMAMESVLAHAPMDDCNMVPIPELGGRMPMVMLVGEFVKLFTAPGPRMHESQIN